MKKFVLLSVGVMSMSVALSGVRPVLADTAYPTESVNSSERLIFQWDTHVFTYNTDGSRQEVDVKAMDAEKRVKLGDLQTPTPVLGYQLLSKEPVKVLSRDGDFAKARRDIAYPKAKVTLRFVDVNGKEIAKPVVLDQGTVNGKILLPECAQISGYTLSNQEKLPTKISKANLELMLEYTKSGVETKPEGELSVDNSKPTDKGNGGDSSKDVVGSKDEGAEGQVDENGQTKDEGTNTDSKPSTNEAGTNTDSKSSNTDASTTVDLKPDTKDESTAADLNPGSEDSGVQVGNNVSTKDFGTQTESEKQLPKPDTNNNYPYQVVGKTANGQILFTQTINSTLQSQHVNTDIKGYYVVGSEITNGNLILSYAPRNVLMIVTSVDENGKILKQDKKGMSFGERFTYTPVNISGYQTLDSQITRDVTEQGVIEYTVHYQTKAAKQAKKTATNHAKKVTKHRKDKHKSTKSQRTVKKNRNQKTSKKKVVKKGSHHRTRSARRHK